MEAKHLIVGGGIAGLFAAYYLYKYGEKNIVLIEQHTIGSGSTGFSAGMLVSEPETASWSRLVNRYGKATARAYLVEQIHAAKLLSEIIAKEKIACDFMPQELLMLGGTPLAKTHILQDLKAFKLMKGKADHLFGKALQEEFPSEAFGIARRTRRNVSVNPLLFARGFAAYLNRCGVRIYEHTPLQKVRDHQANTPQGAIYFENLIRCEGTGGRNAHIARYLTTIAVTRKLRQAELRRIGLADYDMFIDDERVSFHYGKITGDNRLLIGYGDVKRSKVYPKEYVHAPHLRSIIRFLKHVFPKTELAIEYAWSARYALSKTTLPSVLKKGNVTRIDGAGTQLASITAASYAVSKLLGKKHPLDRLFSD